MDNAFVLPIEEVAKQLDANTETGLTDSQVIDHLKKYGPNSK